MVFNQNISIGISGVTLAFKREDLLHPYISGNKFRKLKYNIIKAQEESCNALLTFGGAFSNHILAVAAAGFENNLKTIGVIRGEELLEKVNENPTLSKAQEFGMVFEFVSRETYRQKSETFFLESLKDKFGSFYLLPEGGTNELAVKGCEEILTQEDKAFDFVCCAVGTGGTISGIINSSMDHQQILGFPSLKGDFIKEDIRKFANKDNWQIVSDYHFGGYGKINETLVCFMNEFFEANGVLLDPIYTNKMVFGVLDLLSKNYFPKNSKILMIHTGGIQGIAGMNSLLKNKNLTLIKNT
jgi:1-aminocyclopropane-1-carboxylate deaminase